jgi:hypothetical protein
LLILEHEAHELVVDLSHYSADGLEHVRHFNAGELVVIESGGGVTQTLSDTAAEER